MDEQDRRDSGLTAIYTRVSTTDKGQDPAMQETECRKFCDLKGIAKESIVVYTDKMSGRRSDRPYFQKLISDLENRRITFVVAYKIDRLARSIRDLSAFSDICRKVGANFAIATQSGVDTSTATGNLLFNILSSFAEFESDLISERTKSGMAEKIRGGVVVGGDRKSINFLKTKLLVELYPSNKKRWSLKSIRYKLGWQREKFYATLEKIEEERSEFVTDYSDERYSASVRPFKQKRVRKNGVLLSKEDPKAVLSKMSKESRQLQDADELAKYISKLEENGVIKSFVSFALRDSIDIPVPTKYQPRSIAQFQEEENAEEALLARRDPQDEGAKEG